MAIDYTYTQYGNVHRYSSGNSGGWFGGGHTHTHTHTHE